MSEVTVAQLANDVRIPVDRLLNQLAEAGITKESGDDVISEKEKRDLLTFLRQSHGKKATAGETASKITLKRKSVSELKQPASTTRTLSPRGARDSGKTVSVEVRKKRTIVKGATAEETERLQREAEEARQALADQEAQRKAVELENEARRRAEEDRRRREEETKRAHEDRVKAEEEAQRQADAAAQLQKEEEERKRKEELERAEKEAKLGKAAPGKKKHKKEEGRREELHVADDARGKRRSKKQRGRPQRNIQVPETRHGFQKPTAPSMALSDTTRPSQQPSGSVTNQ